MHTDAGARCHSDFRGMVADNSTCPLLQSLPHINTHITGCTDRFCAPVAQESDEDLSVMGEMVLAVWLVEDGGPRGGLAHIGCLQAL